MQQLPSFYGKGNMDLRGPPGPRGPEGPQGPAGSGADQQARFRLDKIEGDYATSVTVAAAVSDVSSAFADELGAVATRVQTVEADYTTSGAVNAKVSAAILIEQEARASAILAEATRVDSLLANFNTDNTVDAKISAAITSEQEARASAIEAEASRVDSILTSFSSTGQVDAKITAAITGEQTARANAFAAEVTRVDQLLVSFAKPSDIDSRVSAAISAEQSARATAIAAEASRVDQLLTNYVTPGDVTTKINAAITGEQQARASAISAEASARELMVATVATTLRGEAADGAGRAVAAAFPRVPLPNAYTLDAAMFTGAGGLPSANFDLASRRIIADTASSVYPYGVWLRDLVPYVIGQTWRLRARVEWMTGSPDQPQAGFYGHFFRADGSLLTEYYFVASAIALEGNTPTDMAYDFKMEGPSAAAFVRFGLLVNRKAAAAGQTTVGRTDVLSFYPGNVSAAAAADARITSEAKVASDALKAEASRVDGLLTAYAKPSDIDAKVSSAITTEQQARSSAIGAEAARVDQLLTSYVTGPAADAKVSAAVSAAITAEQYARTNAIGAEATRVDNLLVSYAKPGDIDAKVSASVTQQSYVNSDLYGRTTARWSVGATNSSGRVELSLVVDGNNNGVDITGNLRVHGNLLVAGSIGRLQVGKGQLTTMQTVRSGQRTYGGWSPTPVVEYTLYVPETADYVFIANGAIGNNGDYAGGAISLILELDGTWIGQWYSETYSTGGVVCRAQKDLTAGNHTLRVLYYGPNTYCDIPEIVIFGAFR